MMTLSNLGTFAIYAGDLAASRAYLQEALAINPDAHFGRERYQLWLVEQLMLKRDVEAFPEMTSGFSAATIKTLQNDYARFVQLQLNLREGWARDTLLRELTTDEQAKAVETPGFCRRGRRCVCSIIFRKRPASWWRNVSHRIVMRTGRGFSQRAIRSC